MLPCSKTPAALELPATPGSQEPVSAYPPDIWFYPPAPGSTQPSCELMERLISGEESCSQESPAAPALCLGLREWGGAVPRVGQLGWPMASILGAVRSTDTPQPPTHLVRHISARLHHKTLTRHIKAACQPSSASAGSTEPPKPAKTDGKGPDTVAPGYTGSPDT